MPRASRLWAAWMHRKGGVHDIAFTNGRGPRLHHTAFWVPTPLNIIDLLDLMSTTGWLANIERGPGRHGISNAFFLYIRDPDGHRIEIYCSDYQTRRSRPRADQVGPRRTRSARRCGARRRRQSLVRGRQLLLPGAEPSGFDPEGAADRGAGLASPPAREMEA